MKLSPVLLVIFTLLYFAVAEPWPINTANINRLRHEIDVRLGLSAELNLEACEFESCIPKLIRLAFHVCVGACNGGIDLAAADNAGLSGIVDILEELYLDPTLDINTSMSRADFWALATWEGVIQGALLQKPGKQTPCREVCTGSSWTKKGNCKELCNNEKKPSMPFIDFRWGRKDTPESPHDNVPREFPHPKHGCEHVVEHLGVRMNMSEEEWVAILGGGHTVGGARISNSEYGTQPWTSQPHVFDNEFFQILHSSELHDYEMVQVEDVATKRFQWLNKKTGLIFLNVDICMKKDLESSLEETGFIKCVSRTLTGFKDVNCVPRAFEDSRWSPMVERFAKDNKHFMKVFSNGWKKMMANGFDRSKLNKVCDEGDKSRGCVFHYPDCFLLTDDCTGGTIGGGNGKKSGKKGGKGKGKGKGYGGKKSGKKSGKKGGKKGKKGGKKKGGKKY